MNLISMVSAFPLRMSRGTRGRGRQNHGEGELPPPPTMAQVLQNIETNRLRNEQLLEQPETELRKLG